jgi:hypothetical protein
VTNTVSAPHILVTSDVSIGVSVDVAVSVFPENDTAPKRAHQAACGRSGVAGGHASDWYQSWNTYAHLQAFSGGSDLIAVHDRKIVWANGGLGAGPCTAQREASAASRLGRCGRQTRDESG